MRRHVILPRQRENNEEGTCRADCLARDSPQAVTLTSRTPPVTLPQTLRMISVKEESGMCRKAIPDCRIILKQSSSNSLSLCFWYTRINAVKCSDFQITYPYVSLFFILNVRKHSLSKIQYVVYPSHTYKRAHSYRHTSSGVTPSARCHPCRIP